MVLRADVIKIGGIGQRILRDDIDVAAVKVSVLRRLTAVMLKAFAEDHVSGTKTARVSSSKQHGILRHRGKERFFIGSFEWRREHIVAEPIAKHMTALVALEPMRQPGMERHQGKRRQNNGQRR